MASFVAEAQAMLAGGAVAGFERIGSAKSSDSVLRSSSSEDEGGGRPTGLRDSETSGRGGDGRPPGRQRAETMKTDSRGSTKKVTTTRTVSEDDDDAGTINHAGFFGYDGMMGISPRADVPRRRRALPASRASMHDASCRVQRPDFGASPEHLNEAAFRSQDRHGADLHASPSRPSPSKFAWDVSVCEGGLPAFCSNSMSDRIKPREAPVIVDRQRPAQAPEERPPPLVAPNERVWPPPLVAPNERLPGSLLAEGRTALSPRLEEMACSSSSDDHWRTAAAYSKAERAGLPKHQAARQSLCADGQAQRLGRRDVATSLASQSAQYGQAAGVLERPESSAFEKLKAVRVLGRLHAVGMFEARQPLLRAVNCESKMVRVAAVHELLAAPAASHAIGVEQRIELGRILTRVLDERDDSSGLGLQVVGLNALAHLSKSDPGGTMGDSYTMGVVSALCDSQDPDVRSAAVKAIGSLCKPMDVHYSDRLRPRLQDPDATVREHAVRTLVHIGAWGGHDALAASLLSACCDPDPAVQRAAVDALVAALEGEQATAARAVMKRVYEQGAQGLHLPPLLRMMLEE